MAPKAVWAVSAKTASSAPGTDEGECQAGTQLCRNNAWLPCENAVNPADEICDGLDNNCDGVADNNAPCPAGSRCVDGRCQFECIPDCNGRECGDNGCGEPCGFCDRGQECNADGQCACVPNCDGRSCGDDGCGGQCGVCLRGQSCNEAGQCVNDEVDCPGSSQRDTCPPIQNQFGEFVNNSAPSTVMCDFVDNVAICQAVRCSRCYEWQLINCDTCCWEGQCAASARECR